MENGFYSLCSNQFGASAHVIPKNSTAEPLVKHTIADRLRSEISSGALRPGVRIVEGTWARKFGVAQGSIREAINLLAQDGFVTKAAGRSARVVNLTEQNVRQIFEVRGALEGLAARLTAQLGCDVRPLEQCLEMMRHALKTNRPEEMIDGDLRFHLELCRLPGNSYLFEHARKILVPMFAFARIRVLSSGQNAAVWEKDLDAHQRIIDLVKEGHGDVAEQYVHHAIGRFGKNAYENWEKKSASSESARPRRSRRSIEMAAAPVPQGSATPIA
jgi:DNA-binding GntR family transcriptional regulator